MSKAAAKVFENIVKFSERRGITYHRFQDRGARQGSYI
jgi:hypothetical protein